MSVESAEDRAAFVSLDDFGISASWSHDGATVELSGILSAPTMSTRGVSEIETIGAETCLRCLSDDLPHGAGQGDTVEIAGRGYIVKSVLPTGDGFARVWLEPVA